MNSTELHNRLIALKWGESIRTKDAVTNTTFNFYRSMRDWCCVVNGSMTVEFDEITDEKGSITLYNKGLNIGMIETWELKEAEE